MATFQQHPFYKLSNLPPLILLFLFSIGPQARNKGQACTGGERSCEYDIKSKFCLVELNILITKCQSCFNKIFLTTEIDWKGIGYI